jgi:hypothetical protein
MVIGLALGEGVLAQAGADGAYGGLNGRGWQDLTARMRTGYIEGYVDGVSIGITQAAAAASQAGLISPPAVSLVAKAIGDLFPLSMTLGEVVSAVDRFYAEPLNRRIMVYSALAVIALEAKGTDQATVDEKLRRLRRLASAAEEPVTSPPPAK